MRPRVDVDALVDRYDAALGKLAATGARLLVFTAFDTGGSAIYRPLRGRFALYTELVRWAADRHGATVVDFWRMREFRDWRYWDHDRMHLGPAGHARMALNVLDVLGVPHGLPTPARATARGRAHPHRPLPRERRVDAHALRALGAPPGHPQVERRHGESQAAGTRALGVAGRTLLPPRWRRVHDERTMSRTVRLLVILAAWAIPVVWVVMTLVLRPSDGSVVWRSPLTTELRWSEGVSVVEAFGDTPLEAQDQILSIEGQPVTSWLARGGLRGPGHRRRGALPRREAPGRARGRARAHRHADPVPGGRGARRRPPARAGRRPADGIGRAGVLPAPRPGRRPGAARRHVTAPGRHRLRPLGRRSDRPGRRAWAVAPSGRGGPLHGRTRTRRPVRRHLADPARLAVAPALAGAARRDPALHRVRRLGGRTGRDGRWPGPDAVAAVSRCSLARSSLRLAVLVALAATYRVRPLARGAPRLPARAARAGQRPRRVGAARRRPRARRREPGPALGRAAPPHRPTGAGRSGRRPGRLPPRRHRAGGPAHASCRARWQRLSARPSSWSPTPWAARPTSRSARSSPAGWWRCWCYPSPWRCNAAYDAWSTATATSRGRSSPSCAGSTRRRRPPRRVAETLELLSRRLRLSYAAIDVPAADGGEPLARLRRRLRSGTPVTVDLVAGGIRLGSLHLEAGPDRDAFGRGDRLLLEDVGAQVGALVQAVLANRDLMRSRHELVSAREEERRRLRRDLHDGLGPSLATLALRLENGRGPDLDGSGAGGRAGRRAWPTSPATRSPRYAAWSTACRPPALDQLGLVSALRQRAAQHELAAGEGDVVWTVEAERRRGAAAGGGRGGGVPDRAGGRDQRRQARRRPRLHGHPAPRGRPPAASSSRTTATGWPTAHRLV